MVSFFIFFFFLAKNLRLPRASSAPISSLPHRSLPPNGPAPDPQIPMASLHDRSPTPAHRSRGLPVWGSPSRAMLLPAWFFMPTRQVCSTVSIPKFSCTQSPRLTIRIIRAATCKAPHGLAQRQPPPRSPHPAPPYGPPPTGGPPLFAPPSPFPGPPGPPSGPPYLVSRMASRAITLGLKLVASAHFATTKPPTTQHSTAAMVLQAGRVLLHHFPPNFRNYFFQEKKLRILF